MHRLLSGALTAGVAVALGASGLDALGQASRASATASASEAMRPAAVQKKAAPTKTAASTEVERGRYLALAGDCVSCHTAPHGQPYAGGRAIATGFGTLYAPNITPDKETGIGNWTADAFWRALHRGHDAEGHHLYPAFPYAWYTKVSKDDVLAIKAFLDTVPAVHQADKPPEMDWWLRRPLVAAWDLLNFDEGEYRTDPQRSPEWNRGAYLVEGLGHCSACHGASGLFAGVRDRRPMAGSLLPDGWYAPSLGGSRREGLAEWSVNDIAEYLKTGSAAQTAPAGEMSAVIEHSTRWLSDSDLHAIAVYLKSLPPSNERDRQVPPLGGERLRRGEALFTDQCMGCHMRDGGGIPGVFPALAGSSAIQASNPATVLRVVLEGARIVRTAEKPTGIAMPAFGWKLDDAEVADVVTYIRSAWGNRAPAVDAAAVGAVRRHLDHRTAQR